MSNGVINTEVNDEGNDRAYAVMLPCSQDQFGDFIANLLGQPQIYEFEYDSPFVLKRQDVLNTFHIIDQRIRLQNEGTLIGFNVKIYYDDDSSVLLNSLNAFETYAEIKPLESIGVTLSWVYLIQFKTSKAPEKQEISITFRGPARRRWYPDTIGLNIRYTERTWGADMESLLKGHLDGLLITPSKTSLIVTENSGLIGFSIGLLSFIASIIGVIITTSKFIDSYQAKVSEMVEANPVDVLPRINLLIEIVSTGVWPRYFFSTFGFLAISLLISCILAAWVNAKASIPTRSDILLSRKSESVYQERQAQIKRDWKMFFISLGVSIVTGIISNILFNHYFGSF